MKGIWALSLVLAFAAGSIMASGMAYAAGDKNGQPFDALWDAIHELQDAVNNSSGNSQTYYVVESIVQGPTSGSGPGQVFTKTVLCDEDDVATGGGLSYPSQTPINIIAYDFPHVENDVPVGWTMVVDDWTPSGALATVYVVCLVNP